MRFKFEITMRNDFCITEEDILDAIIEYIGVDEDDIEVTQIDTCE